MSKKLVFVSNYFNHHQRALAEAFVKIYGEDYVFIAFTPFNQKRLAIGYQDMNQFPFVLRAYESPEAEREARRIIDEAEIVIIGGMPVNYVASRLKLGKITFMQSERFFKGPIWKDIMRFVKYLKYSGGRLQARDKDAKFYLLCAGGFVANDYNFCGLFRGKAYRWGYFPDLKRYDDIEALIAQKEPASILWAGRFLDWKHPDLAVTLAKKLKASNVNFKLKIIGSGEMQDTLAGMIDSMNLRDCVELTGALPTEQVRLEMEKSKIFLFTSDRGEGWGVVLNEAMNSGCVVIAGEKIGAAPFLLKHGYNGLIFRDKNAEDLTRQVVHTLRNPERISEIGRNAYETLCDEWNAEIAAERFVKLAESLNAKNEPVTLWENGPCSLI
ncbi:MAG: glycosyltransferase family 4 protein [Synergistaceae bacterium]|nr:glycosyltransferase family 4 protein [Synergistaceae bacterium]